LFASLKELKSRVATHGKPKREAEAQASRIKFGNEAKNGTVPVSEARRLELQPCINIGYNGFREPSFNRRPTQKHETRAWSRTQHSGGEKLRESELMNEVYGLYREDGDTATRATAVTPMGSAVLPVVMVY